MELRNAIYTILREPEPPCIAESPTALRPGYQGEREGQEQERIGAPVNDTRFASTGGGYWTLASWVNKQAA